MVNFPIDNRTRVEVSQMPHLAFTLDTFQERYSTMALQLYPTLCTMLLDADANKRLVTAVEMGMLMLDFPRAYAATASATKSAARPVPKLYCWKQGPGAHASADCKARDATPSFNLSTTQGRPDRALDFLSPYWHLQLRIRGPHEGGG